MKNTQVHAYKQSRTPKYHQLDLIDILKKRVPYFSGTHLDVGCASGVFIELFQSHFPLAKSFGVDISPDLIQLAREANKSCTFFVDDARKLENCEAADLVTVSGVLSIFDDYEDPLETWLSKTKEGGLLVVFGCFNSKNIDTQVRFRNNFNSGDWETGLTAYSISTISKYLENRNCVFEFEKFILPTALPEEEDPIRSYTKDTIDGERLILNGANIRTELYHLIIRK